MLRNHTFLPVSVSEAAKYGWMFYYVPYKRLITNEDNAVPCI